MRKTLMIGSALAVSLSVLATGAALSQGMGDRMMRGEGPMPSFEAFDADGDGRVTVEEIESFRANRFAELDADGDGQVSRREFMDHAAARAEERAGAMFDRLDVDGDGVLSRDAIEAREGPGPDAARLIGRLDTDGDGAITRAEIDAARERMGDRMGRRDGMGDRMDRRDGGWMNRMGGHHED